MNKALPTGQLGRGYLKREMQKDLMNLAQRHRRFDGLAFLEEGGSQRLTQAVVGELKAKRRDIRLFLKDHGVLYGKIRAEHAIEDILAEQLANESPNNIILIESQRGCYLSSKKLGRVISINEESQKIIEKLAYQNPPS